LCHREIRRRRGRIEQARWLMLRLSSMELLAFAEFFAVLALFTQSWFMLGGGMRVGGGQAPQACIDRSHA
jgi:hypothetical protein